MPKRVKKNNNNQPRNNLFGLELQTISLKTQHQQDAAEEWKSGKHLLLTGDAGTGKTFIALAFAVHELASKNVKKVIVVRSAVPTRDIGFMPGNISEKTGLYQTPYEDIVNDLCGRDDAYQILCDHHCVQFITTSFLRGITIDDAIVVIDEIQNYTEHELHSIITRLGQNSRMILCGDDKQSDITLSGYSRVVCILESLQEDVASVRFDVDDIQRSGFIKKYLLACKEL